MIKDHIWFFKKTVETFELDAVKIFEGKFFEIYPPFSEIKKSIPCAALRHPQKPRPKRDGKLVSVVFLEPAPGADPWETPIEKKKALYRFEYDYQLDIWLSKGDMERELSEERIYQKLLLEFAKIGKLKTVDNNIINLRLGPSGIQEPDADMSKANEFKIFFQVTLDDAVCETRTIEPMPASIDITEEGTKE